MQKTKTYSASQAPELRLRAIDSIQTNEVGYFIARYIKDLERALTELINAESDMKDASDYLPGDKNLRLQEAKKSAMLTLQRSGATKV